MKTSYYFLILFPLISYAQDYNIGHTYLEFYDETRDRIIPTQIYYPSDQNGENVAVSNSTFPIVVFESDIGGVLTDRPAELRKQVASVYKSLFGFDDTITKEQANEMYGTEGLQFDTTVPESVAKLRRERHDARKQMNFLLDAAEADDNVFNHLVD